jgi:hypothetical protein
MHKTAPPKAIVRNRNNSTVADQVIPSDEIVSYHPFPLQIPSNTNGSPIIIDEKTSILDTSGFDDDPYFVQSQESSPIGPVLKENEIEDSLSILTEEELHNLNEDAPNRIMRRVDSVALFKQQGISSSTIPTNSNSSNLVDFLIKNDGQPTAQSVDNQTFNSRSKESNEVISNQRWRKRSQFNGGSNNSNSNNQSSSPRMHMDLTAIAAVLV